MTEPKPDSGAYRAEIKLDSDVSASSWADAIREMEETARDAAEKKRAKQAAAAAAAAAVPPPAAPIPARSIGETTDSKLSDTTRSRYDEIRKTPTLKMESGDLSVMVEFSEIIARVNTAGKAISTLRKAHPNLFPERLYKTWTDNLKETSTVMMREFHNMRNGRQQKKYDKRCICSVCHSVFMVPLGADQTCDACRAAKVPRGGGGYTSSKRNEDKTGDTTSGNS